MGYQIKVYKIVNNVDDKVYIGSTKDLLYKRFNAHKRRYKYNNDKEKYPNFKDGKYRSCTMFDSYGVENCSIVLIEEFDVENKEQQYKHERACYDKYVGRTVNHVRPQITEEERIETKRLGRFSDTNVKYQKECQSRRMVCDCGCIYIGRYHKRRHEKTKDHINTMNILNDVKCIISKFPLISI
jgi:hypothetical protein